MTTYLADFKSILKTENRYEALRFILDLITEKNYSILEVHQELLTPALNSMVPTGNENIDIWKEHVRTSIIKTIIENLFSYVIAERDAMNTPKDKIIAILCPPEEYHDVGARMAADILTIHGYEIVIVGGNTPLRVFKAGLASQPIDYVAISISNPYHLISTRKMIEGIRSVNSRVKIVIGGNAIRKLGEQANGLKADFVVHSLNDLANLERGDDNETSI